jgi:hypothetical protein
MSNAQVNNKDQADKILRSQINVANDRINRW